MRRRAFVQQLAAALALTPMATYAQQAQKVFRVGYFGYFQSTSSASSRIWDAFLQGLRENGLVEGRNVLLERRFGEGRLEKETEIAKEFVRMNVDLIATGYSSAAHAAKRATSTIPIVMLRASNPERQGLVASLARPGGNVTGMSDQLGGDAQGRHYQLLRETVPRLSRVGVLWNPDNLGSEVAFREGDVPIARRMGIAIASAEVRKEADLEQAFAMIVRERVEALWAHLAVSTFVARIVDFAARRKLPLLSGDRFWADAGALITFGPDGADLFRRGASHIAKILNGARPGDLPVEKPTKFELVINLKTARALGMTLPPALRLQADHVIE